MSSGNSRFNRDVKRFAETLDWAAKRPCLLCGRRPYLAALFSPHQANQHRVNAPLGKVRAVAYTVCHKCSRLPDCQAQVEAKIFAEFDAVSRKN